MVGLLSGSFPSFARLFFQELYPRSSLAFRFHQWQCWAGKEQRQQGSSSSPVFLKLLSILEAIVFSAAFDGQPLVSTGALHVDFRLSSWSSVLAYVLLLKPNATDCAMYKQKELFFRIWRLPSLRSNGYVWQGPSCYISTWMMKV